MKCQKCGQEVDSTTKFCPGCGQEIINFSAHKATQPKKPFFKKPWFWIVVGVLVVGGIGAGLSNNKKAEPSTQPTKAAAVAEETKAEPETQAETKSEAEVAKANEKEFKASCKEITYKKLARNPDKFKGDHFKITGQVIQVLDSDSWFDDSTTLRINITPEENEFAEGGVLWSDTIISAVTIPEGADRILEDDVITLWGECKGAYTYDSVLGSSITLPRVDIEYYKIK
jgi:predicted  nucleic acid-binding Zn-ribbon protein